MEYTTEIDEADGICLVRVTGRLKRPEDSVALQRVARDIGEAQACTRFVFDMRQADIITSTSDTLEAGKVPADPERRQVQQRVALVYASDLPDNRFLETVAVNRGYQVKVFDDLDSAVEWLKSAPT